MMPTEEMADAVRGVLQILRGKPGATFQDVLDHCEQRGDDTGRWPLWVQDAEGYVTEQGAALMIYEIMQAHAPQNPAPESALKEAQLTREQIEAFRELLVRAHPVFGMDMNSLCDLALAALHRDKTQPHEEG